jgi:hypothetical protein
LKQRNLTLNANALTVYSALPLYVYGQPKIVPMKSHRTLPQLKADRQTFLSACHTRCPQRADVLTSHNADARAELEILEQCNKALALDAGTQKCADEIVRSQTSLSFRRKPLQARESRERAPEVSS